MARRPTAGTAQVPAGVTQLDLTSTASNEEPLQPVSYRRLLFAHNEQTIMMGVLTDVLVDGPIDPTTGLPTQVPVGLAAPMVAGQRKGVDTILQGIRDWRNTRWISQPGGAAGDFRSGWI